MKEKNIQTPKMANRLLKLFCGNAAIEDIKGDLEEIFYKNVKSKGKIKAWISYWTNIVSLFFSYAIEKRKKDAAFSTYSGGNSIAMFQNYFKVGVRNLAKNKLFTFINIIGLGVGMSIGLLALAMWNNINSFEEFHVNKDRIYRVITKVSELEDERRDYAPTIAPLADEMLEIPGVSKTLRINPNLNNEVIVNENKISLDGYFAEPSYFDLFTFPLSIGNPKTALENPFSIVLSKSSAVKLFKDENPLNKVIEVTNQGNFIVTGVFEEYPNGTHLKCDMVASYSTLTALERSNLVTKSIGKWENYRSTYLFALMDERVELSKIQIGLDAIAETMNPSIEEFSTSFSLQSLNDITPSTLGLYWDMSQFDIYTMMFFFLLALLILAPACFNYANISIARSMKRATEIGLRKVVGGKKSQIFTQFIVETFTLVLIAFVLALYIYTIINSEFKAMIIGADTLDLSLSFSSLIYFIGFAIFCGLIAGIVPAVYMSKLKPVDSLKSTFKVGSFTSTGVRKFLISAQFAMSLFLIIGVAVAIRQYVFSINFDMGYSKDNILVVDLQESDPQIFINEFSAHPEVFKISLSSGIPNTIGGRTAWVQSKNLIDSIEVNQMFVDEDYISTHEIKLLRGNGFTKRQSDGGLEEIVVNEAFLDQFNLIDSTTINENNYLIDGQKAIVVGVVKDFNHQPIRNKIGPFFFRQNQSKLRYANVKLNSSDMISTLLKFEDSWSKVEKNKPFEAKFLDDQIDELYAHLFFQMKTFGFLSFLAITITCLGLLGMVVFSTENRVKEIGIRKVMGASTQNLMYILSHSFLKLMVIAIIVATPISYFFYEFIMMKTQAYHPGVGFWEIAISIVALCVLGVSTIVWQTFSASRINPVDNLRYE